jgi:hypothetical protein
MRIIANLNRVENSITGSQISAGLKMEQEPVYREVRR